MSERDTLNFEPEDEEFISSFVPDFVHDPEQIEDGTVYRMDLLKHARDLIFSSSPSPVDIQNARALMYEAKFIGEVIRRAEAIRQVSGIDDASELDRRAQETGQGSLFDENSPIRQRLEAYFSSKSL